MIEELLLLRYRNRMHAQTHVTTNLTAAELREAYGERAYDRMRELFNLVSFPSDAPSRRC